MPPTPFLKESLDPMPFLKEAIKKLGISQSDLAIKLGYAPYNGVVHNWITGMKRVPADKVAEIEHILNVTIPPGNIAKPYRRRKDATTSGHSS